MNKTVCVFTLNSQTSPKALALLKKAACVIGEPTVINSSEAADFACAVAAERADIIFAAAELSQFLKAKFHLIKSLSAGAVRSSAIVAAMGDSAPENPKEKDLQAAVPQNARPYFTLDGLYSAFSFQKADGATVIFLPLDYERLKQLFATGLGIFRQKPKSAKPVQASGFRKDIEDFIRSGKSVAIAQGGVSKALISVLSKFENASTAFILAPESKLNQSEESFELHMAELAKEAAKNAYADFGASVSDILSESEADSRFIEVCIANADRAKLAKVFAESDEENKLLVGAALTKLCSMINQAANSGELDTPRIPPQPTKPEKKSPLPLILPLAGIAAAALISVLIAFLR